MGENILEHQIFVNEAYFIMERINKSILINIITDSLSQAVRAVYNSKKLTLKNTGKTLINVGRGTSRFVMGEIEYIRWLREDYFSTIGPRLKDKKIEIKDNINLMVENRVSKFKSLSINAKKDIILSGLLWVGTILLIGGGTDFEGGAPDLDTKIGGIGSHRSVFTHTIILGLGLEFILRFSINLLKHGKVYLPSNKSRIWKVIEEIEGFIEKNEDVLISGIWLGLSIHLLKDANLGASRVKPYNGISFKLNMETHQNIFTGNSFLSFLFGTDVSR